MATLPTEPAAAPGPVLAACTPVPDHPFPWKARVVGEAALLFGPLAGTLVTALNLRRAGARSKGWWTLALGVAATVLIAAIVFQASAESAVVAVLVAQLCATAVFLHLERDALENWERRYPAWTARGEASAVGWALLGLAGFFLLAPLVSLPVRAGLEYRVAQREARAQNFPAAAAWYRRAAEGDHSLAQNELGVLYESGAGLPLNPQEAMRWYRRAAEQGLAAAQFNAVRGYYQGLGTSPDPGRAQRWLEQSADQGYAPALYLLADMYDNGNGVPLDDARAVAMYRKSAEAGYTPAQLRLGTMYALGEGVRPDPEEAGRWWTQAAEAGDSAAMLMLGSQALDRGEHITAYMWLTLIPGNDPQAVTANATLVALGGQMTPEEIQQARRLADNWRAARAGRR